jgi:hypothetical protein
MNTREESVAAAMREAQAKQERQKVRRDDVNWAREWHDGNSHCPRCTGTECDIVDLESEGRMHYETFRCRTDACGARWKVESREAALSFLHDDGDRKDDWIELEMFDTPTGTPTTADHSFHTTLSEHETTTILAALRYWQREGSMSAGQERDNETNFDHLIRLSAKEIDTLCERVDCRDDDR